MSSPPLDNCSGPFPPILVNTDITGPGVIANYVVTAGIAVLLIIIYFVVAYDAARDPFRKTNQEPPDQSFRPNAVDRMLLWFLRYIPKRLIGARKVHVSTVFERSFIKCILAMSDLQIVTGISILISGFVQLPKGLTSYHWKIIVDLAWFSSLTHLACLTILRNYLYNHSLQRMWRIFSMAALLILLVVGLSFTGNPVWIVPPPAGTELGMAINEPAICHLGPTSRSSMSYWTMVFSILLVTIGFGLRIVRLYKNLSINVVGWARAWLSIRLRRLLRVTYDWCSSSSTKSLKRTLCYRPLLALFLMARLLLDGWSSMFLEVGWLMLSFVWGFLRLYSALKMPGEHEASLYASFQDTGGSSSDWGFGQVAAIVLLVAPLITIVEYFGHDEKQSDGFGTSRDDRLYELLPLAAQPPNPTAAPIRHENPKDLDDPNCHWNDHPETLGAAIFYVIFMCLYTLRIIFELGYLSDGSILLGVVNSVKTIIMALIGLLGVILFSLMIETDLPRRPWFRRILHVVDASYFACSAMYSVIVYPPWVFDPTVADIFSSLSQPGNYWILISAAGCYILCAVARRIL